LLLFADGAELIGNDMKLKDGTVRSYRIYPQDFGYGLAKAEEIAGGTPEENALKLIKVLKGEDSRARDIITMNAGAAIYVSGRAATLKNGSRLAEEALDSGKALETLKQMVAMNGDPGKLGRFL